MSKQKEVLWIPENIKELALPSKVIYQGEQCFAYQNCLVTQDGILIWTVPNIESFQFPSTVKVIGENAFTRNKKIKELVIPEGVTTINQDAFSCNQALEDIYLPSTLQKIGYGALKTYQGWGRKYIEFFYPKRIHVPKGLKAHFRKLLQDIPENKLVDDYQTV